MVVEINPWQYPIQIASEKSFTLTFIKCIFFDKSLYFYRHFPLESTVLWNWFTSGLFSKKCTQDGHVLWNDFQISGCLQILTSHTFYSVILASLGLFFLEYWSSMWTQLDDPHALVWWIAWMEIIPFCLGIDHLIETLPNPCLECSTSLIVRQHNR